MVNEHLEGFALTLASRNPRGVVALANKYGYAPPKDVLSKEGFIYQFIQDSNGSEEAFKELVAIHPDRELLISSLADRSISNADGSEGSAPVAPSTPVTLEKKPSIMFGNARFINTVLIIGILFVAFHFINKMRD